MRWFPIKTGLLASLVVLSLFIANPSNALQTGPLVKDSARALSNCKKTYSRTTAHKLFREVYRNPTRVSRHERRTIRRVIRCQRSERSRRLIRRHHARYRRHHRLAPPGNRGIAYVMLWRRGQLGQWPCLNRLWTGENTLWNPTQPNLAGSGAWGIPQALPGHKMRVAGADWKTNPRTQIRWGLYHYIYPRYGSPCNALAFWLRQSPHWY